MKRLAFLLFLALFLLSLFMVGCSRQHKLDARDACSQIGAIYNASKMFRADRDRWPDSVEELDQYGYLEMDEEVRTKWVFTIHDTDSIYALSTEMMSGGAGHGISFDIIQGTFTGWQIEGSQSSDF